MIEKITKQFMSGLLIWVIIELAAAVSTAAEKPEIFPQLGHSQYVSSVAFSPDGRFALSGGIYGGIYGTLLHMLI